MDWEKNRTATEKKILDISFPQRKKKLISKMIKNFEKIEDLSYLPLLIEKNTHILRFLHCCGNINYHATGAWRKIDSREKINEQSFSRAIYHLQMKNIQNYYISATSTIYYQWLFFDYPELFTEIKEFVNENRWSLLGGSLIDFNPNLVDGESIIRQRLYAQRFNAKEFYKLSEFAYFDKNKSELQILPQILKKTGAKLLLLNLNDMNEENENITDNSLNSENKIETNLPFIHFIWRSQDKTEILVSLCTKNNNTHIMQNLSKNYSIVKENMNNIFNSSKSISEIKKNMSNEIIPLFLYLYGEENEKMGPSTQEIIEKIIWEEQELTHNCSLQDFFLKLEKYSDKLPIWDDTIKNVVNFGSYISSGIIKENNRTVEILLNQAESLSVISGLLGREHFHNELVRDWSLILFLQNSQNISGNVICEVIRDAALDYNQVFHHLSSCQESGIMNIAHSQKQNTKHDYYSIYNSLGWERAGYSVISRRTYNHAIDHKNSPLLVQQVSFSPYLSNRETHLGMIEVPGTNHLKNNSKLVQDLEELNIESSNRLIDELKQKNPLESYEDQQKDKLLIYHSKSAKIGAYGIANMLFLKSPPQSRKSSNQIQENETDYVFIHKNYFIKISKSNGQIIHLSYDANSENILNQDGIKYSLKSENKKISTALRIALEEQEELDFPPIDQIYIEENGPLRHTLMIKYKKTHNDSQIHTRISFYYGIPMIFGETLIDWHEENKFLKLIIDSKIQSDEITTGQPYSIQKYDFPSAINNSNKEYPFQQFAFWKAQNEECNIDNIIGLKIFTQGKYSFSLNQNKFELSLLRSPKFITPNKKIAMVDNDYKYRSHFLDQGFHRIPWTIGMISKNEDDIDIIKSAFEYNVPMLYSPTNALHAPISFFKIAQNNVIITCIKEIEGFMRSAPDWFYNPQMAELAFIIRCVEYKGNETDCIVEISPLINIKKVMEVDMLERINNNDIINPNVNFTGNKIHFSIKSYEIKSIMVIARIPLEED